MRFLLRWGEPAAVNSEPVDRFDEQSDGEQSFEKNVQKRGGFTSLVATDSTAGSKTVKTSPRSAAVPPLFLLSC